MNYTVIGVWLQHTPVAVGVIACCHDVQDGDDTAFPDGLCATFVDATDVEHAEGSPSPTCETASNTTSHNRTHCRQVRRRPAIPPRPDQAAVGTAGTPATVDAAEPPGRMKSRRRGAGRRKAFGCLRAIRGENRDAQA